MTQLKEIFSVRRLQRVALTLTLVIGSLASADPDESREQRLVRNKDQGQRMTATLSQNLYRTEVVQVPYTESVPYQDTETYVENVPYTVTVPYQDTEEYYENEYRCHDVTRYREECRNETRYREECHDETRNRRECRNEQKCYIVPGNGPTCRDVEECGVNSRGERICKTRRVCEGGGEGRRECRNEQVCDDRPVRERVCNNVPYTDRVCQNVPYTDRQCANESVRKTRTVTKYREETRYRQETRTRTVTRYRDETRCCRPENRQVFDRQAVAQVEVIFPQGTELLQGEQEAIRLRLVSVEPSDVSIEIQSLLFNYSVARKNVSGANVVIELQATSKLDVNTAGVSSIGGPGLEQNSVTKEWTFSAQDSLIGVRFSNAYELIVVEEATSKELYRQSLLVGSSGLLQQNLNLVGVQGPLRFELKVKRQSSLLPGGVLEFSKVGRFDRPRLTSEGLALLKDRMQVQILDVVSAGRDASFKLQDLTPNYDDVSTSYRIVLSKIVNGDTEQFSEKTLERSALGLLPASLKLSSLMTPALVEQFLRPGMKIQIWVIAKRKSANPLLQGQEIRLERSKNIEIQ